ncbi:MAG: CAP domain-containing protein [Chitinophagaceae bacterium]
MIRLALLLSLFLSSASACTKDETLPADTTVVNGENPDLNLNSGLLIQIVNDVRRKGCNCGGTNMPAVGEVTWNNQLAQAAYNHSADMLKKNYFSHTSPTGSTPGDRIKAAGYDWKAYGENIAFNYTDERTVVEGWLKSPNHCQTIMSPKFKEMGAARSGQYWTQDFGQK